VIGATWLLERGLLNEMRDYLRRHAGQIAEGEPRVDQTLSGETLSGTPGI
jgi:hypothetical protein